MIKLRGETGTLKCGSDLQLFFFFSFWMDLSGQVDNIGLYLKWVPLLSEAKITKVEKT